jgi:uncharacterized protein (TIGR03118 family)
MKSPLFYSISGCSRLVAAALLVAGVVGAQKYDQTNLVSNAAGPAPKTDSNLVNAWGLARSSTTPWWVSDNGTGRSTLYDGTGTAQPSTTPLVVIVPGAPTGTVFNGSADFALAPGKSARFLFASEDGTISGWNPGVEATQAVVVVTTPGAVYKGLTIAVADGKRQLYATDFHGGHIDVFDASFNPVTRRHGDGDGEPFRFEGRLRGLSPFGIQNIGGNLFVTFAKPDAAGHDDVHAPGNGAVAVFTPAGKLIQLFEHVQDLNSPWGLALAPGDFGAFSHHLLVGQFGSGEILAYNVVTGRFSGKLLNASASPIVIDGLWGLSFGSGGTASGPATTLFFSAGPNDEAGGLFGTLTPAMGELIEGNGN